MQNALSQMAMGNSMDMGASAEGGMPQMSPLANVASMSPTAMNNFMGNPMGNAGGNAIPFLQSQQNFMPEPQGGQGGNYASGGLVHLQGGGNPMEEMAAQGAGGGMGGLEQAAMADPGMQEGMPPGEEQAESEGDHPLQELADSVDNQEGMQLTFINAEEHQALMEQTGEEIPPAEQVSDNPEAIAQLMEGAEGDDYMLVYLTEEQFAFLAQSFGEPSINDASGLPQFFKKAFKRILKNPIVQALAPIALNAIAPGVGSAIGGALGLGSAGTSALLGGGFGLLGGGGLKGALKGAALGGLGQMGGEYLSSGKNPLSGMFGGQGGNPFSGLFSGSGQEGSPGFGLTGNSSGSGGVGGINPASPPTGLNPALQSSSLTPAANSIAGAPKTGLAALMPDSLAGKLGLAAAGTALLGNAGAKPQTDGGAAPAPLPATFAQKLPKWNLNRNQQNVDPNSYLQGYNGPNANRKFFEDQWTTEPQAAKHGGLMHYAHGGYAQGGMAPPDAPPVNYGDDVHRQLYGMPSQMGRPMSPMGPMPQGPHMMPGGMPMGMMGGMPSGAQPPGMNPQQMNHGGLAQYNMGGAAYGYGGLLDDEGDGVSDDIPATIGGKQPARLSGGEFVLPARVVSELGNGNTEAGAEKLYQFMDKVQSGMRKNKDVAKNTKAYQYLPT